jgi:signal peptidase I
VRKKILIITLVAISIGVFALVVYRVFFIKMIRVPTGAMANTIVPGDYLITKRLFGEVQRGDIIIFVYPSQPAVQYVSRVVGLPGETIFMHDTAVCVNDKPIPEQRVFVKYPYDFVFGVLDEISTEGSGPYRVFYFKRGEEVLPTASADMKFGVTEPFHIPQNEYFVMGDNRDNSLDSRFQGTVPRKLIWGKPTSIYWSSYADRKVKWERIGKKIW